MCKSLTIEVHKSKHRLGLCQCHWFSQTTNNKNE